MKKQDNSFLKELKQNLLLVHSSLSNMLLEIHKVPWEREKIDANCILPSLLLTQGL